MHNVVQYWPHRCDFYVYGIVWPIVAKSEPIWVRGGLVLLDGYIIGKCDRCGHRYFPAHVVKLAEEVAAHPETASRSQSVPVVAA